MTWPMDALKRDRAALAMRNAVVGPALRDGRRAREESGIVDSPVGIISRLNILALTSL